MRIRRAKLISHTLRHNNLLGLIIEGSTEENNSQGKLPLEYMKQVIRDIGFRKYYELKIKTEKREGWKNAANQSLAC